MIKNETIIADDVYQKIWDIPYQWSLLISVPATNTEWIYVSESKDALSSEEFLLWKWQSINFEWKSAQRNNVYWVRWKQDDKYQIITV